MLISFFSLKIKIKKQTNKQTRQHCCFSSVHVNWISSMQELFMILCIWKNKSKYHTCRVRHCQTPPDQSSDMMYALSWKWKKSNYETWAQMQLPEARRGQLLVVIVFQLQMHPQHQWCLWHLPWSPSLYHWNPGKTFSWLHIRNH